MTRRNREHFRITKLKRTHNRQNDTFTYNISYETTPKTQTQRTREIAEAFGLGTDQSKRFTLYDNATFTIHPTDIVLITGDSGSGKSILLNAIRKDLGAEAIDTRELATNPNTPIIETVGRNTTEAIQQLSKVGLNDAFLFLRTYTELSDGQKHRYQIAQLAQSGKKWWFLDEFTSILDRDTAKIVAWNLQRTARQQHATAICATTHNDITEDLAPNLLITKHYGKQLTITHNPHANAKECTLNRETHITQGTTADYKTLSQFHYRTTRLPPPRKTFTLKRNEETIGAIVYGYPPPTCFGRRQAWKGTLQQLQNEITTITRIVIHPKYRSTGLGIKLIRETLPQAGTPNVETIAVMAKYNPFFEKAGMQKITETKPNPNLTEALNWIESLGFDHALMTNPDYCHKIVAYAGSENIKNMLTELSRKGAVTRKTLIPLQGAFPKHKEFTQKLAQLDEDDLAQVLKRLSFLAQTKVYLFWTRK